MTQRLDDTQDDKQPNATFPAENGAGTGEASAPEAKVHPGIYRRRGGKVDLASIRGPGFGYRLEEIKRTLPEPALAL